MNREQYYKLKLAMDSKTIAEKLVPALQLSLASSNRFDNRKFAQDNNEGFFLQRELTLLETRAIEYMPSDMTSRKLFKVENVGSGIASINYAEILRSGRAAFSGEKNQVIPNATAKRTETPSPVRKGKIKYTISLEEMEAVMFSGVSLDSQKVKAAKEGTEWLLNNTVWFGDKDNGLKGLFSWIKDGYLEAIPVVNGTAGTPEWSTKTAAEIWADLIKLKKSSDIKTVGQIESNVLGCGVTNYNLLKFTTFTDTVYQGKSIYERILQSGMFDRIEKCPELENVTVTGVCTNKSVVVAFSDRDDVFKIHHPMEFTTLPLEIEGFDSTVYCHANTAGLFMYRKWGGSYLLNT